MKQVFFGGTGDVRVAEVPPPLCRPGFVLVATRASLISSGTESASLPSGGTVDGLVLRAIKNPLLVVKVVKKALVDGFAAAGDRVREKLAEVYATGYSTAGVVLEIGEGVEGLAVGDSVACAGAGYACHAETVCVPRNLVSRLPDALDFRQGCFATLGSIALQGLRRAEPTLGETVVVQGLGLIGQLAAQLLRANGCRVLGIDTIPAKLDLARRLGCHATLRAGDGQDLPARVRELTGGVGADAVVSCLGSPSSAPLNEAFDMCRSKGRVVVVGAVGLDVDRDRIYKKELDLRISCSYGPGRYDPRYEEGGRDYPLPYVRWTEGRNMGAFLDLVARGAVDTSSLVTDVVPVAEAPRAYARIAGHPDTTVAVLLDYPAPPATAAPASPRRPAAPPRQPDRVRFGLVGLGGFVQGVHLPTLRAMPEVRIVAAATGTAASASQWEARLGLTLATTDHRLVAAADDVDAVLVGTRHHLHHEQALAALRGGKHVFVEKPLALTATQAREVADEASRRGLLASVGFNRRLAPTTVRARQLLAGRTSAAVLVYRANVGSLPRDHWTRDPAVGGGRIVGEAIHFFDMARHLVGEEPETVFALVPSHEGLGPGDELTATIRFAGGSVATVVYCSLGSSQQPKERVEILTSGRSMVLEDYRELRLFGWNAPDLVLPEQDKGQRALMANFVAAVLGREDLAVTAADGVIAQDMAEACILSARRGTPVAVDPARRPPDEEPPC